MAKNSLLNAFPLHASLNGGSIGIASGGYAGGNYASYSDASTITGSSSRSVDGRDLKTFECENKECIAHPTSKRLDVLYASDFMRSRTLKSLCANCIHCVKVDMSQKIEFSVTEEILSEMSKSEAIINKVPPIIGHQHVTGKMLNERIYTPNLWDEDLK
jgi:hypothetical protein